jgi:hypothetical protein
VSVASLVALAWLVGATHWPATLGTPAPWVRFAIVVAASGGIGFLTNWLAIKMLFRPRQRQAWNPLWPQGLLPREQPRFAAAGRHDDGEAHPRRRRAQRGGPVRGAHQPRQRHQRRHRHHAARAQQRHGQRRRR